MVNLEDVEALFGHVQLDQPPLSLFLILDGLQLVLCIGTRGKRAVLIKKGDNKGVF